MPGTPEVSGKTIIKNDHRDFQKAVVEKILNRLKEPLIDTYSEKSELQIEVLILGDVSANKRVQFQVFTQEYRGLSGSGHSGGLDDESHEEFMKMVREQSTRFKVLQLDGVLDGDGFWDQRIA